MISRYKQILGTIRPFWKPGSTFLSLGIAVSLLWHFIPATATSINFSKSVPARWLEVRELKGSVSVQLNNQAPRNAKSGDRLIQLADRIVTSANSEAVLAIDDSAAILRLTENTVVQVQKLQKDAAGGNITVLSVPKGMARLQVRPFNRPSSRLDIQTPAGVAGVRGTSYGVVVNPTGKTTVATQNGKVAVSGQSQTQFVQADQYSLVIPGQPPTPPQALSKDVKLTLKHLTPVIGKDNKVSQVQIEAQVHPANAVWLNGNIVDTNVAGEFNQTLKVPETQWIALTVRTPLGTEQLYNLFISPKSLDTPTTLGSY